MLTLEETSVDARRHPSNLNSIQFGPWHISYDMSCILPSMCSTKVVCERNDDQFCQFCVYCKELSIPHFPDMVFPKNILALTHKSGAKITFNPLDALKLVACTVEAIEVSCAEVWQEARPDATKKKQSFDWTFSTKYQGTLSDNIVVEPSEEGIDFELLKQKDQILFYHDLTLFEDELHDHGISKLSVKIDSEVTKENVAFKLRKFHTNPHPIFDSLKGQIFKNPFLLLRVMPSHWFVLLRYFLRVDDVLVRSNETRMFHMVNSNYVIREYTVKESKAADLKIPTSQMKDADDVIPFLPVKEKIIHKLIVNSEPNSSS